MDVGGAMSNGARTAANSEKNKKMKNKVNDEHGKKE